MSKTIQEVKDNLELSKQRTQSLIDQANATTGNEDTDLTSAVENLVEGFRQGGEDTLSALLEDTLESYSNENITAIKTSLFSDVTNIEYVSFPNVTNVGGYSFYNCKKLKTANIPNLTSITNQSAFENCESLEEIIFPKLTSVTGRWLFKNCTSLKKADIRNLGIVNNSMFTGCSSLSEVVFYGNKLDTYAFSNCSSLESFDFINIDTMGTGTFDGCVKLTGVYNYNLPTLYGGTFNKCSSLETVLLRNVISIGDRALQGTSKLKHLILLADTLCVAEGTAIFYQSSTTAKYYVPKALIEDYKVATNWTVYANRFVAIEDSREVLEPIFAEHGVEYEWGETE